MQNCKKIAKNIAELQPENLDIAFNNPFSLETTYILFSVLDDMEVVQMINFSVNLNC